MLDPGFYNMDCMERMKEFPDKYFDLAIVDPPYGGGGRAEDADAGNLAGGVLIGRNIKTDASADDSGSITLQTTIKAARTGGGYFQKYKPGGLFSSANIKHWDVAPGEEYFKELARVSKNQIIWGGNYFRLPPTRCFIVWRKLTISENFTMAMCEYAWTSFNDNAKLFECMPQGSAKEKRFHPTQKPVKLYQWLLSRYAKEGDKILDTHCGSASSLIACRRAGLEFVGFEIDPEYYRAAKERLDAEMNQISLFDL